MKGTFPKATWAKQDFLNQSNFSDKINISQKKELTDVLFLGELITANTFLVNDVNDFVKKMTFNSEKPHQGVIVVSRGNKYKDANFDVEITSGNSFNISTDIKVGNNGMSDFFSGSLSPYPYTDSFNLDLVTNIKISLSFIQTSRLSHLHAIAPSVNSKMFTGILEKIEYIHRTTIDPIILNNLIQKELLECISLQVLHKQPSFFATYKVTANGVLHQKFYEKLESYIKPSIFDNKENFNNFLLITLKIYNESVNEISKNIKSSFWQGTGFENIADDIFK